MSESDGPLKHGSTFVSDYSIYKQGKILLNASVWIYGAADLRMMARKGELSDPATVERVLSEGHETTDEFFMNVFQDNKETLVKVLGEQSTNIYLSAMEDLSQVLPDISNGKVVVFDDENNLSECVYAILLDHHLRRIVVVFRGSVTAKDWLVDAKSHMKDIPNPVETVESEKLWIHAGFHEYLFGTTPEKTQCKCEKIMSEVISLLEENPGYHICTTGHSLGAALSILFAFHAAASPHPEIPKPVVCVNYASPRVGNESFKEAFEALEKEGKICCLRVANHKDVITKLPSTDTVILGYRCCPDLVFRHVGMELQLRKDKKHRFIHATSDGKMMNRLMKDARKDVTDCLHAMVLPCSFLCCNQDYIAWHGCLEYGKRLTSMSTDLDKLKLSYLWDKRYRKKMQVRESMSR